jgi:hypothetical protein
MKSPRRTATQIDIRAPRTPVQRTEVIDRPVTVPAIEVTKPKPYSSNVEPQVYETPDPQWTKYNWRCLEQCFTDIRVDIAESLDGELIDPDEIDLEDVVTRFIDTYAAGRELEGEWSW